MTEYKESPPDTKKSIYEGKGRGYKGKNWGAVKTELSQVPLDKILYLHLRVW